MITENMNLRIAQRLIRKINVGPRGHITVISGTTVYHTSISELDKAKLNSNFITVFSGWSSIQTKSLLKLHLKRDTLKIKRLEAKGKCAFSLSVGAALGGPGVELIRKKEFLLKLS